MNSKYKKRALQNLIPQALLQAAVHHSPQDGISAKMVEIAKIAEWFSIEGNLLLASWLSPAEQQQLASFTFAKRKNEWLAGRICAKLAAADFLTAKGCDPGTMNTIKIGNFKSGRPFTEVSDYFLQQHCPEVSISHSNRYAVAIAAGQFCGVDIQESKNTLERVREKFCIDAEAVHLRNHNPAQQETENLTVLWAAKEAIRKAYGQESTPQFLHIHLAEVAGCQDNWLRLSFRYNDYRPVVIGGLFHDYGIAICSTRNQ